MTTKPDPDPAAGVKTDPGDFAEKYFELVMEQTEATREQAIDALKKSNGDLVIAIMVIFLLLFLFATSFY